MSANSSGPEASATISIRYGDADTARHILEAISPDNLQAPQGVSVKASVKGCTLQVSVSCRKGVRSLIATVDDLLSCVQAAERAISEIAK